MANVAGKAFTKLGKERLAKYRNDPDRQFIIVEGKAALDKAKAGMKDIYDQWASDTPDGHKKLAALEKILAKVSAASSSATRLLVG